MRCPQCNGCFEESEIVESEGKCAYCVFPEAQKSYCTSGANKSFLDDLEYVPELQTSKEGERRRVIIAASREIREHKRRMAEFRSFERYTRDRDRKFYI